MAVFVAYADVSAARETLNKMKTLWGGRVKRVALQPMLWRFDQLERPRWCEMALRDATQAAAIVLALDDTAELSPGAETWLRALALRQPTREVTFLSVVGEEPWTIALAAAAGAVGSLSKASTDSDPSCATPVALSAARKRLAAA
jgi:hypothetical protein